MNFTVGRKLTLVIGLALTLIGVAGATGFVELGRVQYETGRLANSALAGQRAQLLQSALRQLYETTRTAAVQRNAAILHRELDSRAAHFDRGALELSELLENGGKVERAAAIDSIRVTVNTITADLLGLADRGDWTAIEQQLINQIAFIEQRTEQQVREINQELEWDIETARYTASHTGRTAIQRLAAIIGASLLLLGVITWLLWRDLALAMRRLTSSAGALAHGDLGARSQISGRSDEIGTLAETFDAMASKLEESHQTLADQVAVRTAELQAEREALQQTLDDLRRSTGERERLLETVRQLQNPVIPVSDGVIVVPMVGQLDRERLTMAESEVLQAATAKRASAAILDITGVPVIDEQAAHGLGNIGQSLRLLGTTPILVGIRPEVAESLVVNNARLSHIITAANLQHGIAIASDLVRRSSPALNGRVARRN